MTDREQIIAAYLQVSDGREWAINGVDEPVPAFYAIAFAAGAASRDAEIAELVAALNRLYVACPTTLECRHFHHSQQERHSYIDPCGPADEYIEALNQARSALAKVRKP